MGASPRRASNLPSDLSFEIIPGTGLDDRLIVNTSASIDERYRALQFVNRLRDRPGR